MHLKHLSPSTPALQEQIPSLVQEVLEDPSWLHSQSKENKNWKHYSSSNIFNQFTIAIGKVKETSSTFITFCANYIFLASTFSSCITILAIRSISITFTCYKIKRKTIACEKYDTKIWWFILYLHIFLFLVKRMYQHKHYIFHQCNQYCKYIVHWNHILWNLTLQDHTCILEKNFKL